MSDSPAGAPPRQGLLCTVLRPAEGGPEARPGITATAPRVVLTAPEGEVLPNPDRAGTPLGSAAAVADPADPSYAPELQLRERRGFLIACPPDAGPRGEPYAFGGNWLWSAAGQFPEPWPIAVHDRDLRLEGIGPEVPRHPTTNLPLDRP
jgi:hypothetical protein